MMKMGLPKEAAQHAMVRDQLDPKILDMDPEKSLKSQTESADSGPPLKDDPKFAKYFKMLKMVSDFIASSFSRIFCLQHVCSLLILST